MLLTREEPKWSGRQWRKGWLGLVPSAPTKCHHYAKVDEGNLIKFGKSKQGLQRYQCKGCTTTFVATRGTLFYRKHTPLKDILQTLALLGEGCA